MAMDNTHGERQELETVVSVLQGRAESYRMFSRLFMKPLSEGDIDELASMCLEEKARDLQDYELLSQGFNDMGRGLHRRHTGTKSILGTDYTMCFDGLSTYNGLRAVPYASVFVGSRKGEKAELFQEPFHEVRAIYTREGVVTDRSLNLPDDHLGFELSFMADMSDAMADALRKGDVDEALRLADVSEDFRANRILSWYPQFFELASKMVETRFYRGVLRATYGYLQLDGDTLREVKAAITGE